MMLKMIYQEIIGHCCLELLVKNLVYRDNLSLLISYYYFINGKTYLKKNLNRINHYIKKIINLDL